MKYHLLPIPKKLTHQENNNSQLKFAFLDAKRELKNSLTKLCRKEKGEHSNEIFYLYDKENMQKLIKQLNDGDEIVLHGEGQPFLIGLEQPSDYDLTPFKLAKLLAKNNLPDIDININLLACFSATQYHELNFAHDTSDALFAIFKYEKPRVTGYTGMIKVSGNAKFSVTTEMEKDKRGSHGSLKDACLVYRNGQLIKKGRILGDNSHIAYSWAAVYIERARKQNAIVAFAKENNDSHAKAKITRSKSFESNLNLVGEKQAALTPNLRREQSLMFFFTPSQEYEKPMPPEDSSLLLPELL
ncbi:hypothetical protein [Legionella parisiensis]|uniref:Uncharacterized protein n=1 Tax=Legionella parisiensis TaxID=45071 RepID=A0A1E5JLW3_9GAMM|nr:hypothetical protein [Legionella parisiensis]KTD40526.1 hypothetical protein Lpar_1843 [Legionella parisiensis]OEH45535.1 hypothetical protein lpari_03494 [Legionella parisiensis]STX72245.1 Uncharacterised protein [Legionella parisiensis]